MQGLRGDASPRDGGEPHQAHQAPGQGRLRVAGLLCLPGAGRGAAEANHCAPAMFTEA